MTAAEGLAGAPEATVARRAAWLAVATTRGEGEQGRTRAYDNWECPGATRGTRGALVSPSCCSRTFESVVTFYGSFLKVLLKQLEYILSCNSELK